MLELLSSYYVYIVLIALIAITRYPRFRKNKKPVFKVFYDLQILQYSFTILLFITLALDKGNIQIFINDITKFSELVTISGVLAGFIFAGVSILYSFMGNEVISKQFKYNFMDHVFTKLFLAILSSITVIVLYVMIMIFPNLVLYETVRGLITLFFLSLFYFIWSIFELYRFLRRLKKVL